MTSTIPALGKGIVLCAQRSRLQENSAAALRVYVEASRRCKLLSMGPDMEAYRQAHDERARCQMEASLVHTELEQHLQRHGCSAMSDSIHGNAGNGR